LEKIHDLLFLVGHRLCFCPAKRNAQARVNAPHARGPRGPWRWEEATKGARRSKENKTRGGRFFSAPRV
jgi:hypothetical protein